MTELTQNNLDTLERVIDRVFAKIGIDVEFTRHFLDRVNDPRNKQQISMRELGMLFAKEYKKWGRPIAKLGANAEAVMKDLESDINVPFVLKRKGNELELVAKTVMRKKNFHTPDREFKVEADTNPSIIVPGFGTWDELSLRQNMNKRIAKIAKAAKEGNFVNVAHDANILSVQAKAFQEYIEGEDELNEVDQVKGKEKAPKKSKPSTSGSQPHPYKGRLVGEAAVKHMWEHYQLTNELMDPREALMKAALKHLDKMVNQDTQKKHTIGGHALHVLHAFKLPNLNARSFARLYLNWKKTGQLTEGWIEKNLYYIDEALDQDEDKTDN